MQLLCLVLQAVIFSNNYIVVWPALPQICCYKEQPLWSIFKRKYTTGPWARIGDITGCWWWRRSSDSEKHTTLENTTAWTELGLNLQEYNHKISPPVCLVFFLIKKTLFYNHNSEMVDLFRVRFERWQNSNDAFWTSFKRVLNLSRWEMDGGKRARTSAALCVIVWRTQCALSGGSARTVCVLSARGLFPWLGPVCLCGEGARAKPRRCNKSLIHSQLC